MESRGNRNGALPAALSGGAVGHSPLSRETRLAHRRRRFNHLVMPVFAERGYQAPTIADLVVAGKVSTGGFYELYGAKDACFLAVLDECIMRVRERIAAAIGSGPSCSGKLLAVLGTIAEVIETEPDIANTILVVAPTAGAAARERHDLVLSELEDLLRSGHKPGMGGAAIPESHEFVAVAGISWVLQDRLARRETAEIQAVLRELGDFFLAAYTEPTCQGLAISIPSS